MRKNDLVISRHLVIITEPIHWKERPHHVTRNELNLGKVNPKTHKQSENKGPDFLNIRFRSYSTITCFNSSCKGARQVACLGAC